MTCSSQRSPHSDMPAAHVCYNRRYVLGSFCFSLKARDWRSLSAPMKSARSGIMKYLLTSAGIKNTSIHDALVDLLGRPLAVAARSLRGTERREHGDGPQHRGGLRPLEAAHRWR